MQGVDKMRIFTEGCVLGYMLVWNELFDGLRLILGDDPNVFSDEDCRDVYQALLHCRDNREPTDIIGAYKHMHRKDAVFLGSLCDPERSPSPYHAPQRAQEVLDWHRGDLIAKIASHAVRDASSGVMGDDKVAKLMSDLSKLSEKMRPTGIEGIGPILDRVMKDIQNKRTDPNPFVGVPTGMPDYDRIMNGLRPETLNVIAARPGVGKSALAVNIARNSALEGHPVLFFSLEMPADKLIARCVSIECDTSYGNLASNENVSANNEKIRKAVGVLGSAKISICDSEKTDINSFSALSRKFTAMNKPNMPVIILDYLQLCRMPESRDRKRYEVVGDFTRMTKQLSRELKCPIVMLSQLSREADDETEPFKCNQHLRESGNIEQDADTITIMLSRMDKRMDELYKERGYADGQIINCAITKNREGRTGRCNMYFEKETQFIIPAKDHHQPYGNNNEEMPF